MQYSGPKGWHQRPQLDNDSLSWCDMLVDPPNVHAELCSNPEACCGASNPICLPFDPTDPAALAENTNFLNSLITHRVRSIDIPMCAADTYAYRQLCLAILAQNPASVVRLFPTTEAQFETANALVTTWPGQVILAASPIPVLPEATVAVRERALAPPQPRASDAPKQKAPARKTSDPSHSAVQIGPNGQLEVSISRKWRLSVQGADQPAELRLHGLGYALRSADVSPTECVDWAFFTTAADRLDPNQPITAYASTEDGILTTQDIQLVLQENGVFFATSDTPNLARGTVLLNQAGHVLGLVTKQSIAQAPIPARFLLTVIGVTAIWEDLTARADLGSETACEVLGDLTAVRDRTLHSSGGRRTKARWKWSRQRKRNSNDKGRRAS